MTKSPAWKRTQCTHCKRTLWCMLWCTKNNLYICAKCANKEEKRDALR